MKPTKARFLNGWGSYISYQKEREFLETRVRRPSETEDLAPPDFSFSVSLSPPVSVYIPSAFILKKYHPLSGQNQMILVSPDLHNPTNKSPFEKLLFGELLSSPTLRT